MSCEENKKSGVDYAALSKSIAEKSEAILGKFFASVPCHPEYLYYTGVSAVEAIDGLCGFSNTLLKTRPLGLKKEGSAFFSAESDLNSHHDTAEDKDGRKRKVAAPLFARLDCSVNKKAGPSGKSFYDSFPVTSLPSSLDALLNAKDLELVDLNDNSVEITLHISFLGLPKKVRLKSSTGHSDETVLEDQELDGFFISSGSESNESLESNRNYTVKDIKQFPYFSDEQKEILDKVRYQLRWLVDDEVISAKRAREGDITESLIQTILGHMKKEPAFRSFYTLEVSLLFIHDERGLELFLDFLKSSVISGKYKLKMIGSDAYLLHFDSALIKNEFEGGMDLEKLSIKFWLIVEIKSSKAFIHVHSRELDLDLEKESEALGLVSATISKICEKVNRLLLLRELHETRYCSPLLIPQSDEDMWSLEDKDFLGPDVYSSKRGFLLGYFKVGQFECPCLYRTHIPLHWRLKSSQALRAITNILEPMSINNRSNVFVYETKNEDVFYLKVSESLCSTGVVAARDPIVASALECISPAADDDVKDASIRSEGFGTNTMPSTQSSSPPRPGSPFVSISNREPISSVSGTCSPSKSDTKGKNTGGSTPMRQHVKESVVFDVHGIGNVGEAITVDLLDMLKEKLKALTTSIISTFLARNITYKLLPEDLEFIKPPDENPYLFLFSVPTSLRDQFSFFVYLRQNLLLYLNPLNVAESSNQGNELHECAGNEAAPQNVTVNEGVVDGYDERVEQQSDTDVYDNEWGIPPDYLSFLYNSIPSPQQTAVETSIGQGIVCMEMDLLNWKRRVVCKLGRKEKGVTVTPTFSFQPCVYKDEETFKFFDEQASEEKNAHGFSENFITHVRVRYWVKGNIDRNQLVEKIVLSVKQTFYDCLLEETLAESERVKNEYSSPKTEEKNYPCSDYVNIIRQLPELYCESLRTSNPSMSCIESHCRIPVWTLQDVIGQLVSFVKDSNPLLEPEILTSCAMSSCGCSEIENDVCHKVSEQHSTGRDSGKTNITIQYPTIKSSSSCSKSCKIIVCGHVRFERNEFETESKELPTDASASVKSPEPKKSIFMHGRSDDYVEMSGMQLQGEGNVVLRYTSFLVYFNDGLMSFYTYNWNSDLRDKVAERALLLFSWVESRVSIMNCILLQKMGLFSHAEDIESSSGRESLLLESAEVYIKRKLPTKEYLEECTSLKRQNHVGGQLNTTSNTTIPSRQSFYQQRKSLALPVSAFRNDSRKANSLGKIIIVYKDSSPQRLMKYSPYGNVSDPLQRHGAQYLEFVSLQKRYAMQRETLLEMCSSWTRRRGSESTQVTPIAYSVSESNLKIFKRFSRIFHYCRAPLLFSDERQELLIRLKENELSLGKKSPSLPKSISDGAPRMSYDFVDVKKCDVKSASSSVADNQPQLTVTASSEVEQEWYSRLNSQFMSKFVLYLVSLGLSVIAVDNKVKAPTTFRQPVVDSIDDIYPKCADSNGKIYLQRVFSGGLVLAEVGFQGIFVRANFYAMEGSRIVDIKKHSLVHKLSSIPPPSISVLRNCNMSTLKMFTKECTRFHYNFHINSFVYDFHLRYFESFLCEPENPFPSFDFISILSDFKLYHSFALDFARNQIVCDRVEISKQHFYNPGVLFDYAVHRCSLYGFQRLHQRHVSRPVLFMISSSCDFDVGTSERRSSNEKEDIFEESEWDYSENESVKKGDKTLSEAFILPSSGPQENQRRKKSSEHHFILLTFLDNCHNDHSWSLYFYLIVNNVCTFSPLTKSATGYAKERLVRKNKGRRKRKDRRKSSSSKGSLMPVEDDADFVPNIDRSVNCAKILLKSVVKCAENDFYRDELWKKVTSENLSFTNEEFTDLMTRVNKKEFVHFDPDLTFLSDLSNGWKWRDWLVFFEAMKSMFIDSGAKKTTRSDENEDVLGLVLINPDSLDNFVYLQASVWIIRDDKDTREEGEEECVRFSGSIITREVRHGYKSKYNGEKVVGYKSNDNDEAKKESTISHVTNVVNAICTYLWSQC